MWCSSGPRKQLYSAPGAARELQSCCGANTYPARADRAARGLRAGDRAAGDLGVHARAAGVPGRLPRVQGARLVRATLGTTGSRECPPSHTACQPTGAPCLGPGEAWLGNGRALQPPDSQLHCCAVSLLPAVEAEGGPGAALIRARGRSLKTDFTKWIDGARRHPSWENEPETLEFMEKVLLNSGVGPQTYMPAGAPRSAPCGCPLAATERVALRPARPAPQRRGSADCKHRTAGQRGAASPNAARARSAAQATALGHVHGGAAAGGADGHVRLGGAPAQGDAHAAAAGAPAAGLPRR